VFSSLPEDALEMLIDTDTTRKTLISSSCNDIDDVLDAADISETETEHDIGTNDTDDVLDVAEPSERKPEHVGGIN
jgi:hypothetical protein